MNSLKTFGKVIYGTGFAYTFGATFYDGICNFDYEKPNNTCMTKYALYSCAIGSVGLFAGVIWPLTLSTKFLIEKRQN